VAVTRRDVPTLIHDGEAWVRAASYDERVAEVERLREVIQEYAQHDSWRCGHPGRYPQDEDCPCGLLSTLRDAGLDWERWRAYPDA